MLVPRYREPGSSQALARLMAGRNSWEDVEEAINRVAGSRLRKAQPAPGATITSHSRRGPRSGPLAALAWSRPLPGRLHAALRINWPGGEVAVERRALCHHGRGTRYLAARDALAVATHETMQPGVVDVCTEWFRCLWRLGRSNSMDPEPVLCCVVPS